MGRKCVRLFWILVVIAGFTGAGVLIYRSFQDWDENPVTTTIETRPITEITFPKVTVCPPKDTYTDLNYDLMMTENMTLDNDTRDELANYAVELLFDPLYDKLMSDMGTLLDEDKYFNWYHGYAELRLPFGPHAGQHDLNYEVTTTALSGNISTQYFGDNFDANKVRTNIYFNIRIDPPKSISNDEKVTLHVKVDKIAMKDLSSSNTFRGEDKFSLSLDKAINDDRTHVAKNYTPPGTGSKYYHYKELRLNRRVMEEDVIKQKIKLMPGFRLSWVYYGKDVEHWVKYSKDDISKAFVRLANILQVHKVSEEKMWNIVKKIRTDTEMDKDCNGDGLYYQPDIVPRVDAVEQQLGIRKSDKAIENMPRNILQTAIKMFIFLNACPGKFDNGEFDNGYSFESEMQKWFQSWYRFYNDLFKTKPVDYIILTLNKLMKASSTKQDRNLKMLQKLFKKTATMITLKHNEIQSLFTDDANVSEWRNVTFKAKGKETCLIYM